MKPTYEEYMAELAKELGLAARGGLDLIAASDREFHRQVDEGIALAKRIGEQIDKVPVMRVVKL